MTEAQKRDNFYLHIGEESSRKIHQVSAFRSKQAARRISANDVLLEILKSEAEDILEEAYKMEVTHHGREG